MNRTAVGPARWPPTAGRHCPSPPIRSVSRNSKRGGVNRLALNQVSNVHRHRRNEIGPARRATSGRLGKALVDPTPASHTSASCRDALFTLLIRFSWALHDNDHSSVLHLLAPMPRSCGCGVGVTRLRCDWSHFASKFVRCGDEPIRLSNDRIQRPLHCIALHE